MHDETRILATGLVTARATLLSSSAHFAAQILRSQRYTTSADVYSFGVVVWECVAREIPFYTLPPFQVSSSHSDRTARTADHSVRSR